MKGRRPAPSATRKRSGLPPTDAPPPDCPGWLDAVAREEWDRVAPELVRQRMLTPVDALTLAAYCQAYAHWRSAEARVRKEGSTILDAKGVMKLHPLARHICTLLAEIRRIGEQFGFTPIARQRIDAPPSGKENDDFEDFRKNGHGQKQVGKDEE